MKTDLVAFQLVRFLETRGVEKVFGLCGHTVIALLDAFRESRQIEYISVRHEQIAAHAADGYARGKGGGVPGVLMTHLDPCGHSFPNLKHPLIYLGRGRLSNGFTGIRPQKATQGYIH